MSAWKESLPPWLPTRLCPTLWWHFHMYAYGTPILTSISYPHNSHLRSPTKPIGVSANSIVGHPPRGKSKERLLCRPRKQAQHCLVWKFQGPEYSELSRSGRSRLQVAMKVALRTCCPWTLVQIPHGSKSYRAREEPSSARSAVQGSLLPSSMKLTCSIKLIYLLIIPVALRKGRGLTYSPQGSWILLIKWLQSR